MDQGTEFWGFVEMYLASIGVRPRRINTGNSRAEGLGERFIGVLRVHLRKVTLANPGTHWVDWLPDTLYAMRTLVSRAHGYTPFRLLYKQEPVFPEHLAYFESHPGLPVNLDTATEAEML